MSARTVLIDLVMRDRTRRGTDSAARNADRLGSSLKKAAAGMAASFGAFSAVDFFKSSIDAASDMSESVSKSTVVFGKSNQMVMDFAANASKSMGMSRQSAIEATATFGNFLGALGLAQPKAASMSMAMVKLAGDMASFNNMNPEDVLLALRSGLSGEAEPLKAFGVDVSDAALQVEALRLGMKKHNGMLTAAQKSQVAYSLIMKQTKTAQGDFARTSGGLANQQRILAAQWMDAKAKIGSFFLPAVVAVVHVINAQLGPGLENAIQWIKDFGAWMRKSSIYVAMIKGALAGLAVAVTIFGAVRLAVMAATAATWLWNLALSANPLGVIIVAIGATVGAVIYAYRHFETFRNIVNAAWQGIKDAAVKAWAVMKVIWQAIKIYIGILIAEFKIVWSVVKVVWAGISTAVKIAWAIIGPVWRLIAHVLTVTLKNAFVLIANSAKLAWILIQIAVKVAWALIKIQLTAFRVFLVKVLGPAIKWLYTNIVRPVFGLIATSIRIQWTVVKTVITAVWRTGIRPVFELLKTGVSKIRQSFGTAVSGIRTVWNKLIGIAKTPVNFVIGIYNNGLVALVNGIARLAGIKTRLGKLSKFAGGGVMPGYAPGRDSLLAAVSPGESIFRPEFTKAVGPNWVKAANQMARRKGAAGVRNWMVGTNRMGGEGLGYANGGIVGRFADGGVVGFLKGLGGWLLNAPEKAAKAVLNKVLGGSVPGSGLFRDAVAGIPNWIKGSIWGWIKDHLGGAGGPGMHRGLAFAKAQSGKPYLWGGVGPSGYDCSGFMSAIVNVIHGRSPYSRLFTTHGFVGKNGPAGFVQGANSGFRVGVTHAGVGHMAGTLLGVNVESNSSQGVHYGPGARGAMDGLFPRSGMYGLTADGGRLSLRRGWNPPVYNGTGRTEHLATGGGNTPVIANYGVIGSQIELDRWLTKTWNRLQRHGKIT